jgi:hypothetical protein
VKVVFVLAILRGGTWTNYLERHQTRDLVFTGVNRVYRLEIQYFRPAL